jgi:hypothetical protein
MSLEGLGRGQSISGRVFFTPGSLQRAGKNVRKQKRAPVRFAFKTKLIEWRGPAPFVYAPVPAEHVAELRRVAKVVSYGWGCVPVEAKIGSTTFTTSLFPKDDTYLLPLKIAVRRKTNVTVGDMVSIVMTLGATRL